MDENLTLNLRFFLHQSRPAKTFFIVLLNAWANILNKTSQLLSASDIKIIESASVF